MTERCYGFRFNMIEAGVLVLSVLLASVLIFLSGIYVGKGVEAHRAVEQTTALRMPIQIANEARAPGANTPLAWKLPKEKPTEAQLSDLPVEESERPPASPEAQAAALAQKSPVRKTLAAPTLSQEQRETNKEKVQPKTEERPTVSVKEKRTVQESLPSKVEDRLTAAAKENPRPVKESSPPVREKARTDTEEGREPPARTGAVQARSNEKPNEPTNPSLAPAQKSAGETKKWKVQVEATSREEVAREIAKSLRAQGYAPSISKVQKEGEVLYRVRVGRFATQEEAVTAIGRFRRDGKFSQAYPVSE